MSSMQRCGCSREVENYLAEYDRILNEMICGMMQVCPGNSISRNFILRMIPHHRAAIEMSENLLRYTEWEPLAAIAREIIEEQTKSIADMEAIFEDCGRPVNSRAQRCTYEKRTEAIMRTMFREMRGARRTGWINADFIREMIPHHCGAIRMSKTALSYPVCPGLIPVLQAIIVSQERGVREMSALLRRK